MPELMQQLDDAASGDQAAAPMLLRAIGHALLTGTPWETVMQDARWVWRMLYIVYSHDKLGTPDNVEQVFFARAQAEALMRRAAQGRAADPVPQRPFYLLRVTEWPLGTLATREARDGFHHEVTRHMVTQIKAALQLAGKAPRGVAAVTIGADQAGQARTAYIDASGRRIVLWEDCCRLGSAAESIVFTTRTKTPLCGLIDAGGDIIVPPVFQQVAPLHDGLAVARRRGKFGYIDASGNMVIPFIYEDAADYCQALLLVKSGGLWGALDPEGKQVIAPVFAMLEHDLGNDALRATRDGRHGYLSLSGELLAGYSDLPLQLAEQSFATERSVFIACDNSREGTRHVLVDVQGRRIGTEIFSDIQYSFHDEGMLCAGLQRGTQLRYGYVNLHGATLIPFRFAAAENFSEGLAAVATEAAAPLRYGYIDRQGNWVIAPRFACAGEFHQGLAVASAAPHPGWRQRLIALARQRIADWPGLLLRACSRSRSPAMRRYGYIDRKGNWAVEACFQEARPFNEGLAPVRMEQGWGYIDTNGTHVTPAYYQEAGPFKHGVARVGRRFGGALRYGLVDIGGREIIPLHFDWLSYPKGGLITACDEYGMWGCLTLYGNIVTPFIYRARRDLQAAQRARDTARP